MSAGVSHSPSPCGPSATRDLPGVGHRRAGGDGDGGGAHRAGLRGDRRRPKVRAARRADRQLVAALQRPPLVAAEAAEGEGRGAAEVLVDLDPAGDQDVRPQARAVELADVERRARRQRQRLPGGDRLAVDGRRALAAGHHHRRAGGEAQPRPDQRALEPRRALLVAQRPVAEAEGEVVHRPRRRHADPPQPDPPRPVLDRGHHPRREDLDRRRLSPGPSLTGG